MLCDRNNPESHFEDAKGQFRAICFEPSRKEHSEMQIKLLGCLFNPNERSQASC